MDAPPLPNDWQVVGGAQGSQVKLSDGSVKVASTAGSHLSKPGTTTLRMTGGVITAASSTPSSTTEGPRPTPQQHHPVLMAANQAAVINAAKNASAAAAASSSLAKSTAAALVKAGAAGGKAVAAGATALTVAKSIANMPVVGPPKGAGGGKGPGTSLVTAASLVSSMAAGGKSGSGMLKIHPGGSGGSQQTVLSLPTNQLKQLAAGAGAMQSILMPVGKAVSKGPVLSAPPSSSSTITPYTPGAAEAGASPSPASQAPLPLTLPLAQVKTEPCAATPVSSPAPSSTSALLPPAGPPTPNVVATTVKTEQGPDTSPLDLINTEHVETMMQLLTAVVKKFPLIVPDKTEDSHPFCASSEEQYYSWNIGKRRASELQRAVAVKRVVQDVLDRSPRLQALTPPKTREVVQWCRQRGYTPPDPEPQRRDDEESMEDILTQIDSEPECPCTLGSSEELLQRVEQMQALLKKEPEEPDNEIVDIVTVTPACHRLKEVKEEEPESDPEPRFFLGPSPSDQFIQETAQQIGVAFQPVEVEKNVFAPLVEAMILKATEQFASDILREALAGAHAKSPQNRVPREISASNLHQAASSIPTCDFLTNVHMGYLSKDD
ncbi:unnamed protein product [Arctogadus glacialis]